MLSNGRVAAVPSILAALVLCAPLSARAQFRMARDAGVRPVFHPIRVRPSATHATPTGRARMATAVPARRIRIRTFEAPGNDFGSRLKGGAGETLQQLLNPVPGLGFDYQHLAAVDSDLGIKAVIDPETEWRLAVAERVLRDTGGVAAPGFYLWDGGGAYLLPRESPTGPSSQPTVIVLQPPPAPPKSSQESPPAAAPQPSAPIPNISNFTLVLKSGRKIQAIAFTRVRDQVVYITVDGARHSLAVSELDSEATRRLNDERGSPFRF